MQLFDREPAFILKRTLYKENQYLLDIFTQNYGRLRAVARITKQKTHRDTENLAPFRAVNIVGMRKHELLHIHQSEIIENYPLTGTDFLAANYLNELLLTNFHTDLVDVKLFRLYQSAIQNPQANVLRNIEFHLIYEQGLLPERQFNAPFYQLYQIHDYFELRPARQGYQHQMITSVESGELPNNHPQLKHYLQTLLKNSTNRPQYSRTTTEQLFNLLKH